MRVLCCESCSSGQRLAALTERERREGETSEHREAGEHPGIGERAAADPAPERSSSGVSRATKSRSGARQMSEEENVRQFKMIICVTAILSDFVTL